ncbi:hypothetical protein TIFTF001_031284 [Ficus carica]|uniref:Uncharacterized protein n=1 Tax=Ficus carica TaxID=3494 RepID=A0AA88DUZ0_FICCA|nr:hypothetical protein TIFTF001_031284 [Ficus carica]
MDRGKTIPHRRSQAKGNQASNPTNERAFGFVLPNDSYLDLSLIHFLIVIRFKGSDRERADRITKLYMSWFTVRRLAKLANRGKAATPLKGWYDGTRVVVGSSL